MAVEYFDDGAILLNLRTRSAVQLDETGAWLVRALREPTLYSEVLLSYGADHETSIGELDHVFHGWCTELLKQGFLQILKGSLAGVDTMNSRYVQNPDVNLREEDEDGALLYNPDTDRVQLLNSTGLFIWKLCSNSQTADCIIAAMIEEFEGASEAEMRADTEEFLDLMVDSGFIGIVEATSL
ncbi:MAG: PqqD family protein [Anaerolineae bacterium]|nr:PqqD family protein [Anaerolineae bacterium]